MKKQSLLLLLCLFLLLPARVFAGTGDEAGFSTCSLGSETIQIMLPQGDSWYVNTPDHIDEDFLLVSKNSKKDLNKYLKKNNLAYNIVSKDLLQEIDLVLLHNSKTKLLFDFNTLNQNALSEQADVLIEKGQTGDTGSTAYKSYTSKRIGKCRFMIFEGTIDEEDSKAQFISYTTVINGYGITVTYRAYDGADMESGKKLIQTVIDSLDVKEVLKSDHKKTAIMQLLPPILLVAGFLFLTVFLFIRQLRRNRAAAQKCD